MQKKFLFLFVPLFFIESVLAHCPLCTIGAGAAAGAAVWLGVSKVVVALFIGAFAMSMGMWFGKWSERKKKIIPFQMTVVTILVFVTTLLPLMPIFSAVGPLYLSFIGDYGKTFAINYSLASGLFGGAVVCCAPSLSKGLTKLRKGKTMPFQGVALTLALLLIMGGAIQLLV